MPVAFWGAACDPLILAAEAEATEAGDPDALDLFSLPVAATVMRDGERREHVLITDRRRAIRLELRGDSIADGPVRLRYDICGISDLRPKIMSLTRLETLIRRRQLPPGLFPSDPVAERLVRALIAWEACAAGATQLEIASTLFGDNMVTESSIDYLRKRVARLIETAEERIEIGYHRFFGN